MAVLLGQEFGTEVTAADDGITPGDDPTTYLENQPSDTLVVFDGGRYPVAGRINIDDSIGWTVRSNPTTGVDDMTLAVAGGHQGIVLDINAGSQFAMDGVHLDMTAPDTAGDVYVAADNWHIRDLEVIGRADPDQSGSGPFITPSVTSEVGIGTLEGVNVPEGYDFAKGRTVDMPNTGSGTGDSKDDWTRQGILVHRGLNHIGTLEVQHCRFEEFGSDAIYASATNGNIQVDSCVFRNCDNTTGVRYHGNGGDSWVQNCLTEIDPSAASFDPGLFRHSKAHWVEAKSSVVESHGALLRNCRVEATDHPKVSDLLQSRADGPDWTIQNCTLIGPSTEAAVRADSPTDPQGTMSQYNSIDVADTTIIGSDPAITVSNRDGSTATDVCIEGGGLVSGVSETRTTREATGGCPSVTDLPTDLGPLEYQRQIRWRVEASDLREHDGTLDAGDTGINSSRTIATGAIADETDLDAMTALSSDPIVVYASDPAVFDATVGGSPVTVYQLGGPGPGDEGPTKPVLELSGSARTKWRVEATGIEEHNNLLDSGDTGINAEQTVAVGTVADASDVDALLIDAGSLVSVQASDPAALTATVDGTAVTVEPLASSEEPRNYPNVLLAAANGNLQIVKDQDPRA